MANKRETIRQIRYASPIRKFSLKKRIIPYSVIGKVQPQLQQAFHKFSFTGIPQHKYGYRKQGAIRITPTKNVQIFRHFIIAATEKHREYFLVGLAFRFCNGHALCKKRLNAFKFQMGKQVDIHLGTVRHIAYRHHVYRILRFFPSHFVPKISFNFQ